VGPLLLPLPLPPPPPLLLLLLVLQGSRVSTGPSLAPLSCFF
jgi:hypothetical protein